MNVYLSNKNEEGKKERKKERKKREVRKDKKKLTACVSVCFLHADKTHSSTVRVV
jgi:hypothetical protein